MCCLWCPGFVTASGEGCRAAYAQAGQATHLVSPPLVLPSAFVGADLVAAPSVMDADFPENRCMRLSGIRLCLAQGVRTPPVQWLQAGVHADSHMRSLDAVQQGGRGCRRGHAAMLGTAQSGAALSSLLAFVARGGRLLFHQHKRIELPCARTAVRSATPKDHPANVRAIISYCSSRLAIDVPERRASGFNGSRCHSGRPPGPCATATTGQDSDRRLCHLLPHAGTLVQIAARSRRMLLQDGR